jgi:PIN domain nuclease of toxin-antitoxin system
MKLLLDTHTFIWWDSDPARLSASALNLCSDPNATILLSVASVWEIQIKSQLGKLPLPLPLAKIIEAQQRTNGVELLTITLEHVLAIESLPTPHKDPFDRVLTAQSIVEGVPLLTVDPVFQQYPVKVLW